jgi:hypothetical protein
MPIIASITQAVVVVVSRLLQLRVLLLVLVVVDKVVSM